MEKHLKIKYIVFKFLSVNIRHNLALHKKKKRNVSPSVSYYYKNVKQFLISVGLNFFILPFHKHPLVRVFKKELVHPGNILGNLSG